MRAPLRQPVDRPALGSRPLDPARQDPTESSHRDIDDLAEYEACLRRVIASGVSDTIDIEFLDASGHPRVHSVLFRAERSQSGAVVGAIAFGRDVTDLVRARHELAAHEHEYRTLAENLPDIVLRYDLDGRTVYVNPQHDEQVNAQLVDLIGRRPTEIEFDGMTGVEEYEAALLRVLATGEPEPCDITLLDRTVTGARTTCCSVPSATRQGVITGALGDRSRRHRARASAARRSPIASGSSAPWPRTCPTCSSGTTATGGRRYVNHQYQLQVHAGPVVGLHRGRARPARAARSRVPGAPACGALTTGEPAELTVPHRHACRRAPGAHRVDACRVRHPADRSAAPSRSGATSPT